MVRVEPVAVESPWERSLACARGHEAAGGKWRTARDLIGAAAMGAAAGPAHAGGAGAGEANAATIAQARLHRVTGITHVAAAAHTESLHLRRGERRGRRAEMRWM